MVAHDNKECYIHVFVRLEVCLGLLIRIAFVFDYLGVKLKTNIDTHTHTHLNLVAFGMCYLLFYHVKYLIEQMIRCLDLFADNHREIAEGIHRPQLHIRLHI